MIRRVLALATGACLLGASSTALATNSWTLIESGFGPYDLIALAGEPGGGLFASDVFGASESSLFAYNWSTQTWFEPVDGSAFTTYWYSTYTDLSGGWWAVDTQTCSSHGSNGGYTYYLQSLFGHSSWTQIDGANPICVNAVAANATPNTTSSYSLYAIPTSSPKSIVYWDPYSPGPAWYKGWSGASANLVALAVFTQTNSCDGSNQVWAIDSNNHLYQAQKSPGRPPLLCSTALVDVTASLPSTCATNGVRSVTSGYIMCSDGVYQYNGTQFVSVGLEDCAVDWSFHSGYYWPPGKIGYSSSPAGLFCYATPAATTEEPGGAYLWVP
jgi:hypothetical protein